MPRTTLPFLLALALFLPFVASTPAPAEELGDAEWKQARKDARRFMAMPGKRFTKQKVIATLARDDSLRAATGESLPVLGGLAPGDLLIVSGLEHLEDGSPIRTVDGSAP